MADIATTVAAAVERAVAAAIDEVAKAGLATLRNVLDQAGFRDSEYLKNYEVYAHVSGDTITFEILLDVEAVVPEDAVTAEAIRTQMSSIEDAARTFGMASEGPQRILGMRDARRDARRPARDARRPARDARTNVRDRLIKKEVANVRPRSLKVDRAGRLSVALRRSVRNGEQEVTFPQNEFQGILGDFVSRLKKVIATHFMPEISGIVKRSFGG